MNRTKQKTISETPISCKNKFNILNVSDSDSNSDKEEEQVNDIIEQILPNQHSELEILKEEKIQNNTVYIPSILTKQQSEITKQYSEITKQQSELTKQHSEITQTNDKHIYIPSKILNQKKDFITQEKIKLKTQVDETTFINTCINADSEIDTLGNNKFLGSQWSVWVHKAECSSWTEENYINIYTIKSIGSFWRFFNNFNILDKYANYLFIMRDSIKPIWEDNENRNGGICSIKIDCYNRTNKTDIGSEVMICLCLLMMNETLIQNNNIINGISYSIKNKNILIKIWYNNYAINIEDKLPKNLLNKIEVMLKNNTKYSYGNRKSISIQCKPIKPEYDV